MKIIVTGSLGHISKPLAEALVTNGHAVIVISSSAGKQKDIEALGATAAIGSVLDVEFLATTFAGADAVYTMVPPNFTVPDSLEYYKSVAKSYAGAIKRAGVKRVVNLSSWGAHLEKGTGVIVGSYHAEKILDAVKGISITHLRPCSFYYNLYHYTGMIKTVGFMGTNYGGDDKLTMVATGDIAAAAAEELETITGDNKIRYIASDEHTCNEIAGILGIAIGKPDLQWLTFTDQQTQAAMEKNGVPAALAAKLVELNAAIHSGLMREDYDLHKPTAMGKVKLEDFAKEFAVAYDR